MREDRSASRTQRPYALAGGETMPTRLADPKPIDTATVQR
jgi:hypothetical protein